MSYNYATDGGLITANNDYTFYDPTNASSIYISESIDAAAASLQVGVDKFETQFIEIGSSDITTTIYGDVNMTHALNVSSLSVNNGFSVAGQTTLNILTATGQTTLANASVTGTLYVGNQTRLISETTGMTIKPDRTDSLSGNLELKTTHGSYNVPNGQGTSITDGGFTFRSTNADGTAGNNLLRIQNITTGVFTYPLVPSGTNLKNNFTPYDILTGTIAVSTEENTYTYTGQNGTIITNVMVRESLSYRFTFTVKKSNTVNNPNIWFYPGSGDNIVLTPTLGTEYKTYSYIFKALATSVTYISLNYYTPGGQLVTGGTISYTHFSLEPIYETTVNDLGVNNLTATGTSTIIGGKLGIGTTNPLNTLHIADGNNTSIRIGPVNNIGFSVNTHELGLTRSTYSIGFSGYRDQQTSRMASKISSINKQTYGGTIDRWIVQSSDLAFYTTNVDNITGEIDSSTEKMRIRDNGNVGIGTITPAYLLHVASSAAMVALTSHYYLIPPISTYNTTVSGTKLGEPSTGIAFSYAGPNNINSVSIKGDGYIVTGTGFVAESDRRIKTNIVDVDDDRALLDIRLLKPKTYTYKDVLTRGTKPVYGFIAQEVKEVLNYAVYTHTETIPNVYELTTFLGDTLTLAFNTTDFSRDASGALFPKLKVKTREGKDEFVNILEIIDEHTVRVDKDLTDWGGQLGGTLDASGQMIPGDKIFVFGQEVNDFHNLNKDAIWTVTTAALQEVDRQLQAEKQKVLELQSALAVETQKTAQIETTLSSVMARLEALERTAS